MMGNINSGRTSKFKEDVDHIHVLEMLGEGKSRTEIVKALQDEGMCYDAALRYYRTALEGLSPEGIDEYRKGLIQVNLDRLEKIISKTIDSNDAQTLRVAKDCISEINKMLGLSSGNKVEIMKNKEGDEAIRISFE